MGKTVDLVLRSSDVKLNLFSYGIPISFENLKLEKKLKCKKIGTTDERQIPDKFCSPVAALEGGRRLAQDSGKGFSMSCTPIPYGSRRVSWYSMCSSNRKLLLWHVSFFQQATI